MRKYMLAGAALALAVAACETTEAEKVGGVDSVEQDELPPIGREHTRMTVDQLSRSVPVVLGADITWEVNVGGTDYRVFDVLATTLGAPDYITITEEPAIPDALFVKFMTDMAKNTCSQAAGGEALVRHQDVADNLRYLYLRFFGERLDDDEELAALQNIHSVAEGEGEDGWYAVCIAMLSSPAFHVY